MKLPYVKSYDIAGYTYAADTYCGLCIIDEMIRRGDASPAARDMSTEDVLWQCARAAGIDYDDLYSFDSDEFPKPFVVDQVEGTEYCASCHEDLLDMFINPYPTKGQ